MISVLYPLSSAPQIWTVWQGQTEGVSAVTWMSFAVFQSIYLTYGIAHKLPPVIIANSLWLVADLAIVIGVLLNQG